MPRSYQETRAQLSGANYVAAWMRDSVEEVSNQWRGIYKLAIREPANCTHGLTICSTWDCVESWTIDYHLYFFRTRGGRTIAQRLGISEEANVIGLPERYVSHEEYLSRAALTT